MPRKTSKTSRTKEYRTVISRPVRRLIAHMGLNLRVSSTPRKAKIMITVKKGVLGAYFGEGVVWIKDTMPYKKADQQMVVLHEIGHAIIDHYFDGNAKCKISLKNHEIKANAVAIAFAALQKLPVSVNMIERFAGFTKTRKTHFEE